MLNWNRLWPINRVFGYRSFKDPCAPQHSPAYSSLGSTCYTAEEDILLKNKADEIRPYLDGRCIYLVGMMGSGKTAIGQILSTLLGYSFFDSDKLIEEGVGGATIADIFKLYGETFFREKETEVLEKMSSSMNRLVISTGGGAVVQPINWKYMHKGIIVFLDVPIEVLARRITLVGTTSRPLLQHGSGDGYVKTLRRLSMLWKERSELYANAHIRVSLGNIATKLGHEDVCNITPTQVAIEALMQIDSYLKK